MVHANTSAPVHIHIGRVIQTRGVDTLRARGGSLRRCYNPPTLPSRSASTLGVPCTALPGASLRFRSPCFLWVVHSPPLPPPWASLPCGECAVGVVCPSPALVCTHVTEDVHTVTVCLGFDPSSLQVSVCLGSSGSGTVWCCWCTRLPGRDKSFS